LEGTKLEFYFSKGKLFFGVIFSLLFIGFGVLMVGLAYVEESIIFMAVALFITVLFSIFFVASILKLIRGYPYIIITDDYIQLDPFTKSEVSIYFSDIENINVSELSFQSVIEIVLYDEDDYFYQLSFHNKVRLIMNRVFRFTLFTINVKVVQKKERSTLLSALDLIIQQKLNNEVPNIEDVEEHNLETDFMEKYDPTPKVDRTINKDYFVNAYGHGLIIFGFSFIVFYLLTGKNGDYLFYIIVSLILFPFAKVLIDWLFGFKLKEVLDRQKGFTYYLDQLKYLFALILFHVSFFLAPIGILFLLIRYIVIRVKR